MAWYNASWDYRVKLTVASSQVSADLTDFPVYVDLSDFPAQFFSNVNSDGSDIRVTKSDGTTEVPREIVFITTGSSIGEMHFKASGTLSSSSDTDFYIYYGNSGASEPASDATYGSENTWGSNYAAVYHMQEDPSGTAPQILDSTSGGYNGTTGGTMTSGDSVAGKLAGNSVDFDGTDDLVDSNNIVLPTTGDVTFSAWTNTVSDASGSRIIVTETVSSSLTWGLWKSADDYRMSVDSATTTATSTATVVASTWQHVVGTYDGDLKVYVDGSLSATTLTASQDTLSTHEIFIGARANATLPWDGKMDEVRVSSSARAATWISTEYNNQNSPGTFYSVGTQEENQTFTPRTVMVL